MNSALRNTEGLTSHLILCLRLPMQIHEVTAEEAASSKYGIEQTKECVQWEGNASHVLRVSM
eukprot:scaffold47093_cov16-Prasinocladus_malaysianus.AAC.1